MIELIPSPARRKIAIICFLPRLPREHVAGAERGAIGVDFSCIEEAFTVDGVRDILLFPSKWI